MKPIRISSLALAVVLCTFAVPLSRTAHAGTPAKREVPRGHVSDCIGPIAIPILMKAPFWDKFIEAVKDAFKSKEVTAWKVVLDSLKVEQKVLIGETTLNTEIIKWHEAWYGSITMKTNVKYLAKYTSDMRDVSLSWDASRNTITIVLPETIVESVEQTEFVQDVSYSRLRIFFAAYTREALANATRQVARAESKRVAEEQIAEIRADGVAALQSVLEEKLQQVKPGITVIVK